MNSKRLTVGATIAAAAMLITAGPASALVINPIFDATITSRVNATQIEAAFNKVASVFETNLASPATINIQVSWGKVAGNAIPTGVIGASLDNLYDGLSFSQIRRYLTSSATRNPVDTGFAAAVKSLPTTTPGGVTNYALASSQAKALGLVAGNQSALDGYIGFSSAYKYGFNSSTPIAGAYDFASVAYHEIDEALGRMTGLDDSAPSFRSVFDLYRYASAGKLSFGYWTAAYLSLNGGKTNLGAFNVTGAGDRSDWKVGLSDAQLAYMPTGVAEPFGAADWAVLDALGWNQAKSVYLNAVSATAVQGSVDYAMGVPEPGAWSMILAGLGLGGLALRRRRASYCALGGLSGSAPQSMRPISAVNWT
jgi:hypothetical protein